jgi:hypothetical protein
MSNPLSWLEPLENLPEGTWAPMTEFENLYMISTEARIYGMRRRRLRVEPRAAYCSEGYLKIELYDNKRRRSFRLHTAVMRSFFPGITGEIIRHIDGDRMNNSLSNLCYDSQLANMRDRKLTGGYNVDMSTKLTKDDVWNILSRRADEGTSIRQLAVLYCVTDRAIRRALDGSSWKKVYDEWTEFREQRQQEAGQDGPMYPGL